MKQISRNDFETIRAAFEVADAVADLQTHYIDYFANAKQGEEIIFYAYHAFEAYTKLVNAVNHYAKVAESRRGEIVERLSHDL